MASPATGSEVVVVVVGYFITLEGPDGGGKSTQLHLLLPKLRARGLDVVALGEPGGTSLGRAIRRLVLDPERNICPEAEVLLYAASRAQAVYEVVLPALREGKVVVMERFLDSSLAYQAAGLGIPADRVREANALATAGLEPDLTILLDIDPAVARQHRLRAARDRVEARDEDYQRRVREGFLEIARDHPERVRVVDASLPLGEVERIVWSLVEESLYRAGLLAGAKVR
jgi:dTMP kinase